MEFDANNLGLLRRGVIRAGLFGALAAPALVANRTLAGQPEDAVVGTPPDLAGLIKSMLDMINAERARYRLSAVTLDPRAAALAQAHAEDMAAQLYFSHVNTSGLGPEHRAGLAGISDYTQENIYKIAWRYRDGRAAAIPSWPVLVRDAHNAFMRSPGHATNVLDPLHTHVGIGFAHNPGSGDVCLVQEFVKRHSLIQPLPQRLVSTTMLDLRGELIGVDEPLINVAHERMPLAQSVAQLQRVAGTYFNRASVIHAMLPQRNGRAFSAQIEVGRQGAGIYIVRLFVRGAGGHVLIAQPMVVVG